MSVGTIGLGLPQTDALELRPTPRLSAANPEQARKVGQDFEQMFLSQMLSPMFETLGTDGPFGGGNGERMFRTFQVDEFARAMVKSGGIGIAAAVTREMIALQEKANG